MSRAPTKPRKRTSPTRIGLYTYRYHRLFAVFDAVYQAAFFGPTLAYIVLKALAYPGMDDNLYGVLLPWLPTIISISAPIWGTSGRTQNYWLIAGVGGRLIPCILLAFVTAPWQAIALITLMSFFGSGVPPMQNSLFGRNYLPSERDRFHARSKIYFIPIMIGVNLLMMSAMDSNPDIFRIAFPIAGVFGLLSCLVMYRTRVRWVPPSIKHSGKLSNKSGIIGRFASTIALFRRDRDFAIYELGFMLYGCGFMILTAVVPVFYLKRFEINYSDFSLHTMLAFQATTLLAHMIIQGRTSAWSPQKLAGTAFGVLIFFPLTIFAMDFTGLLALGLLVFVIQGAGMTLLGYAWNFGPIKYAKGGDPKPYVSAHMSLVGVRGLIAYPMAWVLLDYAKEVGYEPAVFVPAALFGLAMMTSFWLALRAKKSSALAYAA